MKRLTALIIAFFALAIITVHAQTTVSGTITDAELGEQLIGANIIIQGTSIGTNTDLDGAFSLTSDRPLPWTLSITYTGYIDQTISITNAQSGLNIALETGVVIGQEIVVSASRRREKVQEAPASISVLDSRKLMATPNDNPVRNLINTPGVQIQQQSAGKINIQMRGTGGVFASSAFPIMDYRALKSAGLGTFDALNSPLNNLDLERIEVVRGPGSALYGPGVTAGVVHFITKSPIDKPGTSIELVGGELSTYGGSFRHATKVSDKFGFKINGVFKRGGEFLLDPNDPDDAASLAAFKSQVVRPSITNGVVDGTQPGTVVKELEARDDGSVMQDFWNQKVLTTTLEFRPQDDLSVNLSGGWNSATSVYFNTQGEGVSNGSEYWGQARVQKGGFFAQAFYLYNDGGTETDPTWLYRTGLVSAGSRGQFEAQAQYNFETPNFLKAEWTAGLDYRLSTADTENLQFGRFEDDDEYAIYGAYLQGKFALAPKLDLFLAGRADRFNFFDETGIAPRAVAVYKASPKHTFRFGYNRAIDAPFQLIVNADFPLSTPVPGRFDLWLVGNREEQTFAANPEIVFNKLFPFPNLPVGTPGFPNAFTYAATNAAVQGGLIPGLQAGFEQQGLPTEQAAAIAMGIQGYLNDPANRPQGFTGNWESFSLATRQAMGIANAPVAKLRLEDTWELGYKGLVADKLAVSIDVYNRRVDGQIAATAISPSWRVTNANFGADLGAAVATQGLQDFIFNLLGGDNNPAAGPASAQLTQQIGGAYTMAGDAFGNNIATPNNAGILAVTPTENVPQDGITHLAFGMRTFEAYNYWGSDIGLEYYLNQNFSLFGNLSWISEREFDLEIVGTDGAMGFFNLPQSDFKFRLGGNFTPAEGWRANLAYQYDNEYETTLGIFGGTVPARNVVDLGVGYKFNTGLSIDVSAQNLFNNEYRQYPGFPKIGRRTLVTLRYDF